MDEEATLPDAGDGVVDAQSARLKALQAQLEAAQTKSAAGVEANAPPSISDEVLLGYSFLGLMACLVWSIVALGMLRYAKLTGEVLWAVGAVLLFVLTYVSQNDLVLWGGGAGLLALLIVVRRFVTF
jgi:hypothetical protein